jgi:hypothetical protein
MPETDQPTAQPTNGQSPWDAQAAASADDASSPRPELLVGAALIGGLVLAQVLKRFGGDD